MKHVSCHQIRPEIGSYGIKINNLKTSSLRSQVQLRCPDMEVEIVFTRLSAGFQLRKGYPKPVLTGQSLVATLFSTETGLEYRTNW